jgi:hypothetical protein
MLFFLAGEVAMAAGGSRSRSGAHPERGSRLADEGGISLRCAVEANSVRSSRPARASAARCPDLYVEAIALAMPEAEAVFAAGGRRSVKVRSRSTPCECVAPSTLKYLLSVSS